MTSYSTQAEQNAAIALGLRMDKLCAKIKRSPYFEDRLEYAVEDLAKMYSITQEEATVLHSLLRDDYTFQDRMNWQERALNVISP